MDGAAAAGPPAVHAGRSHRGLIARILDAPHAALVVRQLQPELLHRVIQTCGLEDSADLVALATPAQLQRVFDLDLWRQDRAGTDEQLDPDRFATWIEVLMEAGVAVAAGKLAAMDPPIVITALAQHVLVFDQAAVAPPPSEDGDVEPIVRTSERPSHEVGGFLVEAKRTRAWETIVELLVSLDAAHPEFFQQVMRGCRTLSNSGFEIDGLDDLLGPEEQDLFDVAVAREQRREQQGYLSPAEARAFLQTARQIDRAGTTAPTNPIAHAHFRAAAWEAHTPDIAAMSSEPSDPSGPVPATQAPPAAMADVLHVLSEAGVLTPQPRGLLAAGPEDPKPRLSRLEPLLELAREIDPRAWSKRTEELAFVANALVAGCSMQGRPFTPKEASDAAAATCNLGLENWPAGWVVAQPPAPAERANSLPDDLLVAQDLIGVFQIGWAVLHNEVCMHAAHQLRRVLAALSIVDPDIRAGLDGLRGELARQCHAGAPWRARPALHVIVMLDQLAWAALCGLFDECPVLHAAIGAACASSTRAVDPAAFEFISENRQIAAIREFMQLLPGVLRG